ncbi:ATP-binding protein [Shewanella algae]|uniref:ATP-binding protein n=1 Tax=Shewanella algae TaxID=38313 RepID=UPI001AACFE37|nr:ATP-binding protein [Shewanella algae]MBO2601869.1 ATP-binding protein [Shewanella algae]
MQSINAEPTKEFFISMLTRDISLLSSLVDLVDNSVDAALNSGGFLGKNIKICIQSDKFEISDNCGGISKNAAINYAFKFGRPITAPNTPHSVGRFGVGMKRALFKMGRAFKIYSKHIEDSFLVDVNVDNWIANPADWQFQLVEQDIDGEYGTKITVEKLHSSISDKFTDSVFINHLISMIGKSHFSAIKKGLQIYVNDVLVKNKDIKIKVSEELGLVYINNVLNDVSITIKAGVGERDIHEGGWYVFCNDRMIEGASKSSMTGWGVDGIRSYHADVAFFRGVIEFKSADGAKLPWNTTKTGIDTDNPIYRSALVHMKLAMRKVTELLKDRVREQEALEKGTIQEGVINIAIEKAPLISIFDVARQTDFVRPILTSIPKVISQRNISYYVSDKDLNLAKNTLGVSTNKDVGLLTFKYFLDSEC